MSGFEFFSVPRIVFGTGCVKRLGELARPLGHSALVIHNGPAADRCVAGLEQAGVLVRLSRQAGEPKVEQVDAHAALGRASGCDLVIGMGGGSAIDAAKAVAMLLANGGTALDYMEVVGKGQKVTRQPLPWIAVPTTAGTGAEATRNAVIGTATFKASIRSERMLAQVALVDPALAAGAPAVVTAGSGADALCQCIESFTSRNANPMSDALALRGIELAARSLRRVYHNGDDLSARTDLAMAALLSGITLTNVGLGAVHGFAAPLGAHFPAPHGVVCGVLLPPVVRANLAAMHRADPCHPGLARYATVGKIVASNPGLGDAQAREALIHWLDELMADLKLPRLGAYGLSAADVVPTAALALKASSMRYNPIELSQAELAETLSSAV